MLEDVATKISASAGIEAVAFWLPQEEVDNVALGEIHDFPREFITDKLGIESRRELANDLAVSDMAAEAVKALLLESEVDPADIQLMALVTQTGDFSLPHTSAIVQHKAGISESAFVFDISLGCSGFVMGLDIALAAMERLQLERGILVTADAYTRIIDPRDRATSPLFGDGAAATLLTRTPKWVMGKSVYGSKGDGYENLIVRGSGSALGSRRALYMDGRNILDFTRKSVPPSVKTALKENAVTSDSVDYFVFHQANAFVLKTLTQDLGLDPQKVVSSFSDIGNTTSSSIPIALRRVVFDGPGNPQRILISGFGVGLSWSSSVLFKAKEGKSAHGF